MLIRDKRRQDGIPSSKVLADRFARFLETKDPAEQERMIREWQAERREYEERKAAREAAQKPD